MVRPNQIISSDLEVGQFTFAMFARSESQVKRRVLLLNFPGIFVMETVLGDQQVDEFITNVRLISTGAVNRYAVAVDLNKITDK